MNRLGSSSSTRHEPGRAVEIPGEARDPGTVLPPRREGRGDPGRSPGSRDRLAVAAVPRALFSRVMDGTGNGSARCRLSAQSRWVSAVSPLGVAVSCVPSLGRRPGTLHSAPLYKGRSRRAGNMLVLRRAVARITSAQ